MGLPVIVGDVGGIYTYPSVPPLFASFPVTGGSSKTFIHGRPIALLGQAVTAGGPIVSATLFSLKTLVEGKPVLLGGAVTILGTGWLNGTLQAAGAGNVQVS